MAREAGFNVKLFKPPVITAQHSNGSWVSVGDELKAFEALIRADTLANIDPSKFMSYQEAFEAGRLAEREACWRLCEGWDFIPGGHEFTPQQLTKNLTDTIAAHIRARGNT
jgi:hypothetical protein